MNSAEYVVFKLNDEYYGIDIHNVENIEKLLTITRVPYTESHIEGVVNLRGNVIPVVDLRKRFDLPKKELNDETRIIIVNINDLKVGMIVDSSSEVLKLERTDIDVAPAIRGSINVDFIREIGKSEGRIVMLIDLKKVLGIDNIENE